MKIVDSNEAHFTERAVLKRVDIHNIQRRKIII